MGGGYYIEKNIGGRNYFEKKPLEVGISSKKNMGGGNYFEKTMEGGYYFEKAHFGRLPGTYPYHTPFRGHLIQTRNLSTFQNQLSDDIQMKIRNFGRNEFGTLIVP